MKIQLWWAKHPSCISDKTSKTTSLWPASNKWVNWKATIAFQRQTEMMQYPPFSSWENKASEWRTCCMSYFSSIPRFEWGRLEYWDQLCANIKKVGSILLLSRIALPATVALLQAVKQYFLSTHRNIWQLILNYSSEMAPPHIPAV